MKSYIILFLILSLSGILHAQKYDGAFSHVFDFQQPDAVSEAMGKVQVALTGSPASAVYNPAASSFGKGLSFQYNYIEPYSIVFGTDPHKSLYAISYNTNKYGAFSFTTQHYNFGTYRYSRRDITSPQGYSDYENTPTLNRYCLNYSYAIPGYFSIGLNANIFEHNAEKEMSQTAYFFDLGLMKDFQITNETYSQNIIIAAAVTNFTYKKVDDLLMISLIKNHAVSNTFENTDVKIYLPTQYRFGASYEFESNLQLSGFKIVKAKALAEYLHVDKSDYYNTIKIGAELTMMEMLKLRIGYYKEKTGDENNNIFYKDYLTQSTYGVGLNLPIHKLLKTQIPMNLQFDFSGNEASSEYDLPVNGKKCYIYNFCLNLGI